MPVDRIVRISGTAIPIRGDNIDTDRIVPARFLRSVSFEGLEDHLFADDRAQIDARTPRGHPVSDPRFRSASILLVNANFGCGSSREHAPQAISRRGISAVLGQSFSEIFFGNSLALGMPCVSAETSAIEELMRMVESDPATMVSVDLDSMTVTAGAFAAGITLPAAARLALRDGTWDATGLLLERYDEVESVAVRLPYVTGWR
ncbi:MAG TPA: 3-isopropylmalate dehydratase small subunit [Vicinamibacterales bacterium]|nr:3-isopropylmalate dehydratase small subunit [Vicinamibacterales bacterium]